MSPLINTEINSKFDICIMKITKKYDYAYIANLNLKNYNRV